MPSMETISSALNGSVLLISLALVGGCLSTMLFGAKIIAAVLKDATVDFAPPVDNATQNRSGMAQTSVEGADTEEITNKTQIVVLLVILGLLLSPILVSKTRQAWREYNISRKPEKKMPSDLKAILLKTTLFDDSELDQWYKGFYADCPSGLLNLNEFLRIYRQFFPRGNPDAFARIVFRHFDQNGDGQIDFAEFITTLSVTSRGTIDQKIEWAFEMYDQDGRGRISYENMLTVVRAIYEMVGGMVELPEDEKTPEARVVKLFKKMDSNEDGFLSFEEFRIGSMRDPSITSSLSLYDGMV